MRHTTLVSLQQNLVQSLSMKPLQLLVLMAVTFGGIGWLSPTPAHSQTIANWSGCRQSTVRLNGWNLRQTNFLLVETDPRLRWTQLGTACQPVRFASAPNLKNRPDWFGLLPAIIGAKQLRPAISPLTAYSWIGGTGNWSNTLDWNPHGDPGNNHGDTVVIDSGLGDVVNLDLNRTIGSLVVGGSNLASTLQNLMDTPETLTVTGATSIDIDGALAFGNGSNLRFEGGLTVGGARAPYGATFSLNDATATITGSGLFNPQSVVAMTNGSTLTVNGNLTNNGGAFSTGYNPLTNGGGGGNTVTVNGGFTNTGSLTMYGVDYGGAGDTLNVTGTFTNGAGATLDLVGGSDDVANIGMLSNSGTVDVGYGTTLILTHQPNGITDVPLNSALNVYGTLNAGSANGLAKLASVEGALVIGNYQTTADTPGGGTLYLYSGASLGLIIRVQPCPWPVH